VPAEGDGPESVAAAMSIAAAGRIAFTDFFSDK